MINLTRLKLDPLGSIDKYCWCPEGLAWLLRYESVLIGYKKDLL
jgi:hypothetical protein